MTVEIVRDRAWELSQIEGGNFLRTSVENLRLGEIERENSEIEIRNIQNQSIGILRTRRRTFRLRVGIFGDRV